MNKIISIPLLILILFSGITVNIASHYCGGSVVATKISFSGEIASCGMESPDGSRSSENVFARHCCENISSAYTINNNYVPSYFSINYPAGAIHSFIDAPLITTIYQDIFPIPSDNTIRPPGINCPNSVDRQVLCIFRI